jgi:hypothetical protein
MTALPDGITMRVDSTAAYAPVPLVYCGTSAAVEGPSPVIVVEVAARRAMSICRPSARTISSQRRA